MRSLLSIATFLFLLIFLAYIVVEIVPSDMIGGVDRVRIVSSKIEEVGHGAWNFGKPILQLIVVLAIAEWVLTRAGIKTDLSALRLIWDVRSLLAILVVAAFCLAALAGSEAAGSLENVCLVVVGFYFGGLTRPGITRPTEAPVPTPGQD